MTQTLIYASPLTKKKSREEQIFNNLYIYTYKYNREYGNGMLVVAARNPMRAMEIIRKRLSPIDCPDINLEHLVGAIYEGTEGIKSEQSYSE